MQLNLPILDQLADAETVLIAGAGGGFDIYAGLPLYFTLREMGKTVHLANYSFSDLDILLITNPESEVLLDKLVLGVRGSLRPDAPDLSYLPEGHLADWFHKERDEDVTIWSLATTGAKPLIEAYQKLTDHLKPDAIILVDGGVDSLMRGNESGAGSLVEDTLSLIAVSKLDVPVKILATIGFGTEVEEVVCHYNALDNMANLVKVGAFYGSCSLTRQMPVFDLYEAACLYAWEPPGRHRSHISTRVIPAVHGEFGDHHMYERHTAVCISPLMSIYWFFDASLVIEENLIAHYLEDTESVESALAIAVRMLHKVSRLRPSRPLPY